jgi:hypothetical protein
MTSPEHPEPQPYDKPASALTWALLLARWTDFARQAVGLPKHGATGRLRESVPSIISLQAVCFALDDLKAVPRSEQAVGIDRAGAIIHRDNATLLSIWQGEQIHPELITLIDDANAALARAEASLSRPPS